MEVVMAICAFSIQISGYTTILVYKSVVIQPFSRLTLRSKNAPFFDDSYINLLPGRNWFSFSVKPFKFCFSMRPYQKDIINIAQPNIWQETLDLKKISLCFIHIDTGVWRSKPSSNCSSWNLLHNFVIEFKQIIFQNKFS